MYEEYFGLSGAPFKLNPDPKFFFGSRSHNKAMAYLHYGLRQAEGFIVITGPVGAGKSIVIGRLLDQLNRSNIVAAQLLTSSIGPDELLTRILSAFRIEPATSGRTGELEAFEDYLFDQLNRGRRVLLIMDEAQNLPHETLEELRMLSNFDYQGTPLFQVFLVGQPEFRETIGSKQMEQLKQRVIASYHLESLCEEETKEYILHRLGVVGWKYDPEFDDDAFRAIFKETEGRPRRINTLCNRLMLYCALEKRHRVTAEIVQTVISEFRGEALGDHQQSEPEHERSAMSDALQYAHDHAEAQSPTFAVPVEAGPRIDASAMSVFDRLRARRNGVAQEAPEIEKAPSEEIIDEKNNRGEVTMTDIAEAIEAATQKGSASAKQDGDGQEANDRPHSDVAPTSPRSMRQLINGARAEIKAVSGELKNLRRDLAQSSDRRKARRAGFSEALARAQSLLDEIQARR